MTRVLVDDGSRHTQLSGYGNLSRAIMTALIEHTSLEISIRNRAEVVPDWVSDKSVLDQIPVTPDSDDHDCVLHICSPGRKIRERKPCLLYTQNALSKLRPEWVDGLKRTDAIVVPGEFDARVFRQDFDNVHVCHQYVDERIFKPRAQYRREGTKAFSFLFVGAFGYRKGVDLLLKAFPRAFDQGQQVNLTLHCFSGFEMDRFDRILDAVRDWPRNLSLSVYNGNRPPEWMSRIYNQHDVVISLSRGEGWCMPLHEALLCEKPIIAADSTAMAECLPDRGTIKIPTRPQPVSEITGAFGAPFRKQYGFSGNACFEPDLVASIAAMRRIYFDYDRFSESARAGREFIVTNYSKQSLAKHLLPAIRSVL